MRGNKFSLNDYRWLLSDAADRLLTELGSAQRDAHEGDVLRQASSLRKHVSADRAHLLLEQLELRRRGRIKFALADSMFFTPLGLEQATDEWVAGYKAQRYAPGEEVADLCCGIGGDLLTLARRGPVCGVDLGRVAALMARANAPSALVAVADVAMLRQPLPSWHIDPDRRSGGRRTTRAELYSPGPRTIETLLATSPTGAIKLAPAATFPMHWLETAECEWISRAGVCRQLVAWFGRLADNPGRRRATLVIGREQPPKYHTFIGAASEELAVAPRLGRYLAEPDAAVLAAGLVGSLAAATGLAAIAPGAVYLTGDTITSDPALTWFEITDETAFNIRGLKVLLRDRRIGDLEIKKRGVDVDPARLRQQLRTPGEERATLFLVRRGKTVTALLTRRQALLG